MKTRNGFVSNSSSSSFVIDLNYISAHQINQINSHIEIGKALSISWASEENAWDIDVEDDKLTGSTFMDNFDMFEFLEKIGVDMSKVERSW